jgi:hypothetical protein
MSIVVALGTSPVYASGRPATPQLPKTYLSPLTPAQIEQLAQNASDKVIVLFKNQHTNLATPQAGRVSQLAADQRPVLNEFAQLHASHVHAYSFVNAVSATISKGEAARLQQDPAVQAVVPDTLVQAPASTPGIVAAPAPSAKKVPAVVGSGTPADACPSNPAKPILEPEALQSMYVDFGTSQLAAHSLATGAGVKVAVFPDGLDPNIPDFMRGGKSAIFDYQDFTGEGKNGVTGGEEAFGDASSIIAQGTQTYDLSGEVNPAHPLPAGCNIRIEGVAPGADLAVMKVFGDTNFAFNSEILQGIDYAVSVDHVNILSESFGGNPVPNPGTDPIAVADQDAVNAGITVVVSSGDAGVTNTIGSPAVIPGVISAGASTDYRLYQQTTSYGIQCGTGLPCAAANKGRGWLSDQVSGLSSSGVTEANRTIDALAPGEAGWAACSTDTATFTECADMYHGASPQPIVAFGGTSESAPLTAGVAALVIQAYRSTHGGVTPSPALVKKIITSTSRDIDARAADQGAGLVNALRAVQAAEALGSPPHSSLRTGSNALLYSTDGINVVGAPGSSHTSLVTVTNDGAGTQTIRPKVRALGAPRTIASGQLALNQATDPTFIYQTGASVGDNHEFHFTVPANTARLHAAIAWNQPTTELGQTIRFDLFDPEGRLALQSRPQGPVGFSAGGFSEGEIADAQPGTWTFLVFSTNFIAPSNYTGPLSFKFTSQSFVNVPGTGLPAAVTLAPGSSATLGVTVQTPSTAGDSSESLVFGTPASGVRWGTVPITLRSLATVGTPFTGVVTGGNSRMPFYGQELPYQFNVTGTHRDLDADIHVAHAGYQILAFLVDPSGTPVDVQSSQLFTGAGTYLQNIHLSRQNPTPGRWSLLVVQVNNVSSLLTSASFTATLRYNTVAATATGLPNSTSQVIGSGSTRMATIRVTNTGNAPEGYIVDARRSQQMLLPLTSLTVTSGPLPISNGGDIPEFFVPPFSPLAGIAAESTVPITMDTTPDFGTPDVEAVSHGDSAVATATAPELPASIWSCPPSPRGPFTAPVAPTTFTCGAMALTNQFASDVSTSAGNVWSDIELGTSSYHPLVLNPGQSGTIPVAISPTDRAGATVSGFLALETFNFNTISSDELVTFPYQYRVGA